MPLLRGCCSLDLKVGTKIIGIVSLILNLFGFLCSLLSFVIYMLLKEALIEVVATTIRQTVQEYRLNENATEAEINEANESSEQFINFVETHIETVKIILIIIVCQQLIDIVCSSCLIHGIRKNYRGLLVPWIATNALYVIIELLSVILLFVFLIYFSEFYRAVLPTIASFLIWMALHIYFVLVVISQYQALGLIRMHDEMCMK